RKNCGRDARNSSGTLDEQCRQRDSRRRRRTMPHHAFKIDKESGVWSLESTRQKQSLAFDFRLQTHDSRLLKAVSAITTHVLDTSQGHPARGVPVHLEMQEEDGGWRTLGTGVTDRDGRLGDLLPDDFDLQPGIYRLIFETAAYFEAQSLRS